jgi:phenylalanyl-tRNA synthetase beta chain
VKFTLSWLKEHLETDTALEALVERLTMLGLEVDAVTDPAAALGAFVVGAVSACEPHPDADRLKVCRVDIGDGAEHRVVCGAPNARAGMKGVFAAPGTVIPATGKRLKKGRIRGVESHGMLCSAFELGLGDDHTGIIELPETAAPGAAVAAVLGLDDPVIDLDLTPNRSDCLGVAGIARDLAAAGLGRVIPHDVAPLDPAFDTPLAIRLDFPPEKENACPLFIGRLIRGVRNRESPEWLRRRLEAIGLRPISALVDITNYLTIDRARPLHVFDADRVRGDLVVRLAKGGERLLALDGKEYELDPEVTVIADDSGVLSLGGVIGGEATGCTDETVNVIVEAALFDPVRTTQTGRRLGIESDARHRFERGVDPASTLPGMAAATRLILDLCGGEPGTLVVAGAVPVTNRKIPFRPERVRSLGGVDLTAADSLRILKALGFDAKASDEAGGDEVLVEAPSWRGDVEGEADLVEEVLRVHGYDHIPVVALADGPTASGRTLTPGQQRSRLARRLLAEAGLMEAITWSFISSEQAQLFGGVPPNLRLVNPISANLDAMRPSLLPGLIAALGRNAARGFADAALFEVGPRYRDDTEDGQVLVASGVRGGAARPPHWCKASRMVDLFDAKADALLLLSGLGVTIAGAQVTADAPPWYHPGRSGTLRLGPKTVLAHFGDIHPRILERMDIEGPVVGFEVFLDNLPLTERKAGKARPPLRVSRFPAVERDFAFVVEEKVTAQAVARATRSAARDLVTEAVVFDVYTGAGLAPGTKSLALRVTLQPRERTMTDAEIDAVSARIVESVGKATGGTLRA